MEIDIEKIREKTMGFPGGCDKEKERFLSLYLGIEQVKKRVTTTYNVTLEVDDVFGFGRGAGEREMQLALDRYYSTDWNHWYSSVKPSFSVVEVDG